MRRPAPLLSAAAADWWRDSFGKVCLCLGPLMLIGAAPLAAFAQYRFDHWTADNGLPQNSVRDIVQTRDGYLWLTTFDGLVRFDGVRFTVFSRAAGGSDVTTEKK